MKGRVIEQKIKLCFYDLIRHAVRWSIVTIVGSSTGNTHSREEIPSERLQLAEVHQVIN